MGALQIPKKGRLARLPDYGHPDSWAPCKAPKHERLARRPSKGRLARRPNKGLCHHQRQDAHGEGALCQGKDPVQCLGRSGIGFTFGAAGLPPRQMPRGRPSCSHHAQVHHAWAAPLGLQSAMADVRTCTRGFGVVANKKRPKRGTLQGAQTMGALQGAPIQWAFCKAPNTG